MQDQTRRLAALSLAALLPSLGTSIANVALPDLAAHFDAPLPDVQWIVIAYLVAVTALIVTVGRLGDLYGRRRLLLAGTALFAAASAAGAFAPTLSSLVALRAVQGAGAAVMMALSVASVGDLVPRERTGATMGLLATVSALGTALGPSLGGVLVAHWGWSAVFAAMAGGGGLACVALHRLLPTEESTAPRPAPRLDLPGIALLSTGLAVGAFAATGGAGLTPVALIALSVLSVALLAGFIAAERRARAPLVDLGLLLNRGVWPGLVQMALMSMIVMTTLVVGPFYLTWGLGLSAAMAGLVLSVGPGVVALVGFPAGRLVDRRGAAPVAVLGLAVSALGSVAMTILPDRLGVVGYATSVAAITAGYALFQAANATAILGRVGAADRGTVSGLLALARNAGLIAGASVMGTVFALGSRGAPALGLAPGSTTGLHLVFALASLAAAAALLLAAAAPRETGPGGASAGEAARR